MKSICISLIITGFLLAGNVSLSKGQTPEQLYQQGLIKEEGEGELQDAIGFYNQVADNSGADLSLRAKALLHIGMCYEKLGVQEAVKAYQRLVSNFPTAKNEVAIAQERLNMLMSVAEEPSEKILKPKFTKINIPTEISWSVALSPDGKELALVSDMKLWKMPLEGNLGPNIPGAPVHLNTDGIGVEWSGLSWSRDGKWIAFNDIPRRDENGKRIITQRIFAVSSDGGKPELIHENYRGNPTVNYRISLSPDAKQLAFSSIEDRKSFINTISTDGTDQRRLTDIYAREPVFSPDGKLIAFVESSSKGDLGLRIVSAEGGISRLVVEADRIYSPIWSPDGKMIAYVDEMPNGQIYIVNIDPSGNKTSKPYSIEAPDGISEVRLLAGWTPDNKIGMLALTKQDFGLYTMPSEGGQAAKILNDCYAMQPRWSKDGKQIYYVESINNSTTEYTLASVSSNGGKGKVMPIKIDDNPLFQLSWQGGNVISPDGKSMLTAAWTYADTCSAARFPKTNIWQIALDGSEPKQVIQKSGLFADISPCWSPDGKSIAFLRMHLNTEGRDHFMGDYDIYVTEYNGTELKKLASTSGKLLNSLVWSPNGKMIAYLSIIKDVPPPGAVNLNVIDIETGKSRIIGTAETVDFSSFDTEMSWSPDSKRIAINDRPGEVIKIVTLSDGIVEDIKTGLVDIEIHHLDWSPDGTRFVFHGSNWGKKEFWLVENFLPLDKLQQKPEKKDLLIRKALANTDIEPGGAPSPDGRYISFIDWNSGGNLGILDLKTEERKVLTDFKNQEAYYSSWSPDGQQIAYFWLKYDEGQYNRIGLSVVDVKKAVSRDLFISDYDKYGWMELGNWSSDGKYIFATLSLSNEPKSQLVSVSTVDGKIKVLKIWEGYYSGGKPYFSPDNRFVAYDLPDKDAYGNSDIFLLSLENGEESALIKHPAHDYMLGWAPDGKAILFASDRSGTVDAMLIAVREGKPAGQPRSVTQNIGPIVPMGLTKDGSFYYGQWPAARNIFTAEINIDEGKLLSKPTLLVQRFEGRNYSPDYSSDGKYLAYISGRGVLKKGEPGRVLCIRDLETDEEKLIIPDPEIWNGISEPQWSPDDNSIALACDNKDGYARIYRYDIQTRKFTPLVTGSDDDLPDTEYAFPLWSRDGKSIYYLQLSRLSHASYIKVRNISTGVDKELFKYSSDDFMDRLFNISLSPDGKWLAAINRGENRVVRLISTDDGKTKVIHTFKSSGGYPYSQVWSRDGKYIIIPYPKQLSQEAREWNLMRIPVDGGESLLIEMNIHGVVSPSLHPDGRTLAFWSAGYSSPENNIWEMKYFLPPEEDRETLAADEPEGIRIRQVWKSPYLDDLGTVSYDGKYRSYVDWGVGDVALHNLVTDEKKKLTDKASQGDTTYFALGTAISKNGKLIASSWWKPHNTTDLILVDVENPSMNVIYSKEGEEVYPYAWLSDHEIVAIRIIPETRTIQIVSFDILDKSLKVKKSFYKIQDVQFTCSPDEKYIAYNFDSGADNENLDINLLLANGNDDIPLIKHPSNDKVLGWVPGRKEFLFLSDRSGTWDLWAIKLDDNKPSGPAKRIYAGIGGDMSPMGITQNGKCYFGFVRRNFYASIAPFDGEKGKIDMEAGQSLKGSNYGIQWSPDGKYLVYKGEDGLIIRDLITGKENEIADNIYPLGISKWSPDGKSILVVGLEESKFQTEGYKGEIFLVDMKAGQADEILSLSDLEYNIPDDDAFPLSGLEWSPDGKSFYYLFFKDRLAKHDLKTGTDEIICKNSGFSRDVLDLSPDGKYLLFGLEYAGDKKSRLFTIPADGGKENEICTVQEDNHFETAFWSPDGKYIYFVERPEETNLWRVPADGGGPEKVWSSENRVEIYDIHPDGDQVAFAVRERATEVRVIENLAAELDKVFNTDE